MGETSSLRAGSWWPICFIRLR